MILDLGHGEIALTVPQAMACTNSNDVGQVGAVGEDAVIPPPVQVFTARIGYVDPDVLDITRKSGDQFGRAFAPSWTILKPALDARARGDMEAAWPRYVGGFRGEMHASRENNPGAWRAMLARRRVVLVCYCSDPERCHRTLLARDILPELGATYGGELVKSKAQGALF